MAATESAGAVRFTIAVSRSNSAMAALPPAAGSSSALRRASLKKSRASSTSAAAITFPSRTPIAYSCAASAAIAAIRRTVGPWSF